jgi:iron complex outermembrane receptor protein
MVNGKRRHRSGVIAELGSSLNEGSQGPDISAIPALAIKQVEVLRDGAAAQYGSDAIAGVMNFVLRDDADGMTLEARTGEYMEGDGTLVQLMGNAGFPLGDDGFFNVTGVWSEGDPTSRSIQRTDAATLLSSGAPDQQAVRQPFAQIWGRPEYRDNWNIFANSGIQLNESQEVYLFGNYGKRETEGGFFYRNPNSRSAVYTHGQTVDNADTNRDGVVDASDDPDGFEITYRAVVDTTINRGDTGVVSNCPALVSPGSGGDGVALDAAEVAADYAARQALMGVDVSGPGGTPDGVDDCWIMNVPVPGGYTPQFGGNLTDASIVGGIRGEMNNGLLYDFSGGYGRNKVEFFLNNTWNPARGPDGVDANGNLQRDFDVGSYVQSEVSLNADFVLPIAVDAFASDLNFAFGAEWRDEIFETIIGEINSWEAGRFAFQSGNGSNCYEDPNNPGNCDVIRHSDGAPVMFDTLITDTDGDGIPDVGDGIPDSMQIARLPDLSIGSHGFAGFNPPQAGQWGRSNWAIYAEAEADITDRFTAAVAVRYEDFATFGDTTNGKVALRFALTDALAVRGSWNTGFRAPTPGQENVTKVSTILINDELSQSGQIPPTNPIAQFLGGKQLEPEESDNFSVGVVWDVTDNLSITADYFNINVSDRIAFTGTIDITDEAVPASGDIPGGRDCPNARANPIGNLALCLQELGVPGASDLSSVSFYTNDFETTTQGIDLVATLDVDWGNAGSGTVTLLWNWTEQEVDSAGSEVDRNKVVDLENMNPEQRGVLTYNHYVGDWRFLARVSYYDDWVNSQWGDDDLTPRGADGAGYTLSCAGPAFNDHCYSGETIVDLEAAYTFADRYTVAVGANNVFDEFGADDLSNADGTIGSGNLYTDTTPWGIEGGFWYLRLRAEFD